ncbi:polyphenol oxidase family protein [Oligella urethralis]|uniref:Laccase domain protein yfiH n=1 Tax=Oligella urethralis TaxID=90245 RepID=A0A2N6QA93_9BURK|nr:polyphenol oxidase family protein [Oligella urethralis]PMC16372.1 laccase domain-containing protein [Oligella urethralis]SPY07902.1 Laccase domain protein yfiH [Oligella urethralis]
MEVPFSYPKPHAAYRELHGLPVISGPAIDGLAYFSSTASSGREVATSGSADRDAFGAAGFNLGLSTGAEPDLVLANRARLQEELPATPIWIAQVHGAAVFDADQWQPGDEITRADASITTQPERVLVVQTADCMPLVLLGAEAQVLGVVHAGWRSLLLGVLENTIEAMRQKVAAPITHVWIGPSIGAAAFEVGAEVRAGFVESNPAYADFFTASKTQADKYYGDLVAIANHKLHSLKYRGWVAADCGIYFSGLCTYSLASCFYSYRRNAQTGRQVTVAYLTKP